MKKKLCRITALLLAAVLSLGGCGQPGAGKKRTDSTQQTEETKNKKEDQPIGTIPIDSIYTPKKRGRRLTALPMSRQWI